MAEIMFPLEDTDYLAEDMQALYATRTSGIYGNEHLVVSPSGGMKTAMSDGLAWLKMSKTGGAVYANRDALAFTHDVSDAVYTRIDRIVIRADIAANRGYAYVLKGTPSSNPVPPEIRRDASAYEISRAQVRIRSGATEITAADITDESMDESVCGIMTDGMKSISTSMLYAQVQEMLTQLEKGIQTVYDGVSLVNVTEYTGVLLADSWTGAGPFVQRIETEGVLASDKPFVDVDMTGAETAVEMENRNNAWSSVLKASAENGSVVFYFEDAPGEDVPIKVKVVR